VVETNYSLNQSCSQPVILKTSHQSFSEPVASHSQLKPVLLTTSHSQNQSPIILKTSCQSFST